MNVPRATRRIHLERRLWWPRHPEHLLLPIVIVQAITGLAAIAALIFALQLGPRVKLIEKHERTIERIVKEVMPGKSSPPGLPWRAPRARGCPPSSTCRLAAVSENNASTGEDLTPTHDLGEVIVPEIAAAPADIFEGHYANAVVIARTPHEFTLDFLRVGPGGKQAVIVSRINLGPLALDQLHEIVGEQHAELHAVGA